MSHEDSNKNQNYVPWDVYPRPRMRRQDWVNLNGCWQFDLSLPKSLLGERKDEDEYGVQLLVPYPPESELSEVNFPFIDSDIRFYRRPFRLPEELRGSRYLLHFGAVDQTAEVFVNGHRLGIHEGGYEPFTFDITEVLEEQNELIVRCEDRLDDCVFPYGKQRHKRGGMWYKPISGIWQTVWIEAVPETYIEDLEVMTEGSRVTVRVDVRTAGKVTGNTADSAPVSCGTLTLQETGETFPITDGTCEFTVASPEFWTPENPKLYDFSVDLGEDHVESYFALRDLTVQVVDGMPRLCLNGAPYYFHGVLDQGYFPDGIFLPEDPAAYEKDILMLKRMGFNMLRKHIKIEPQVFYYACDRLGMAVFQDMVENGRYSFFRDTLQPTLNVGMHRSDKNMHVDLFVRKAFRAAMESTVKQLKSHPSVVYWTIFNEAWGQFEADENYRFLRSLDSTCFIDATSGWFEQKESDVVSRHVYFKSLSCVKKDLEAQRMRASAEAAKGGTAPMGGASDLTAPAAPDLRPVVLSEYGGYACAVTDHLFDPKKSYGYRTMKDTAALNDAVEKLFREQLAPLIEAGLSADVYTQLSDVEEEINGLVTYDRAVEKLDAERMKAISEEVIFRKKYNRG